MDDPRTKRMSYERIAPLGSAYHSLRKQFSRTFGRIGEFFTRKRPWYELPTSLALARIFRIRERLRDHNLHDTTKLPSVPLAPDFFVPDDTPPPGVQVGGAA